MLTPDEISRRADALREQANPAIEKKLESQRSMALRIAVELASCVVVGGVTGYFLDDWLGTSPILLVICILFGSAAGFVTIKRINDRFVHDLEKTAVVRQERLDK